jgi:hypothetical protein
MGTVLAILFWWFAINIVAAVIWAAYCLWPRRRMPSHLGVSEAPPLAPDGLGRR